MSGPDLVRLGALGLLAAACGGSEFDSTSTGGATGGGGAAGSGGTTVTGGSAGAQGGTTSGGGTTAAGGGGGASTPIKIVQSTSASIDGTSDIPNLKLSSLPKAGNAIIVGITCFSEVDTCAIPANGVSDNQGNLYTLAKEGEPIQTDLTTGVRGYIFIADNIGAASEPFVISANPNGSMPANVQQVTWGAIEVSGLGVAPSLDKTGTTPVNTAASTKVATQSPTSQANQLAVAVFSDLSNDPDVQCLPEQGWKQHQLNQNGQSVAPAHSMVSKLLSTTGIVSHTWTHDASTAGATAIIATFNGLSPN